MRLKDYGLYLNYYDEDLLSPVVCSFKQRVPIPKGSNQGYLYFGKTLAGWFNICARTKVLTSNEGSIKIKDTDDIRNEILHLMTTEAYFLRCIPKSYYENLKIQGEKNVNTRIS